MSATSTLSLLLNVVFIILIGLHLSPDGQKLLMQYFPSLAAMPSSPSLSSSSSSSPAETPSRSIERELTITNGAPRATTFNPAHFVGGHPDGRAFAIGPPDINRKFYFFHAANFHGMHYYRQILTANGWTEARNFKDTQTAAVTWTFLTRAPSQWKTKYSFFEEGRHLVNHSPGDRVLFNKEPFMMHLRQWGLVNGCDYTEIHPETLRLHDANECEAILKYEADHPERRATREWFTKILEGTFGLGVEITSLAELRVNFTDGTNLTEPVYNAKERKRVCSRMSKQIQRKGGLLLQRAVHPFLTQGRKFDLRVHVLIANMDPYYVYYNTRSAYLRRSTIKYDPNSDDKASAVTNSHFQMHEEGFSPTDHLWGLHTTFKEYMLAKGFSEQQFDAIFEENMKKLMLAMFHSFKHHLNRKNGYWLLLGADVIVDEDMHMTILEANTNPALRYDVDLVGTEAMSRFWNMSHETINLVYEVYQKTNDKSAVYDPLHMDTQKHYELLYTDDPRLEKPYQYADEMCFRQDKVFRPVNPPRPFLGETLGAAAAAAAGDASANKASGSSSSSSSGNKDL